MPNSDSANSKEALMRFVSNELHDKLRTIKAQMTLVQEAANSETKSVAGDKYETGRAMAHLELEKFAEQLSGINHSLEILSQIQIDHRTDVVQFGSWVRTSAGDFFISCPVGEITFNGKKVFLVSLASPLARKLIQKRSGESVAVNGRTYVIEEII